MNPSLRAQRRNPSKAQLGSDPNSGQGLRACQSGPTDLGSDPNSAGRTTTHTELLTWLPTIIGLAVLYLPSLYDLFTGIWSSDEQMHGPAELSTIRLSKSP